MAVFGAKCPVNTRERGWIDENVAWFLNQFGAPGPPILPTSEFFPPPFTGTDGEVRALVWKVGGYMNASVDAEIEFRDDLDDVRHLQNLIPGGTTTSAGAAGTYGSHDGRAQLTIDRSTRKDPTRLVAVIAHELGHARLIGEGRISPERKDGEPLTDLVTVYLGMGIFTANAAFDFSASSDVIRGTAGWRAHRLGYLTEQMFGYALARYAHLRGETKPSWAKFLDTNPRAYMRQGLRFLGHAG